MTRNVGDFDQSFRLAIALVLLSIVLVGSGDWRWLGLVGFLPLFTAIFRVCPIYTVLHINTRKETPHV